MTIRKLLEQISSISSEDTNTPYLAFPLALETGLIDDPLVLAKPLMEPAGVTLTNGYIPNARGAGVTMSGEDIIVFDHVSIDVSNNNLVITPSSKENIADDGKILGQGILVAHLPDQRIKITKIAINTEQRPWLAYRLARGRRIIGKIAVFGASSLDLPEYELLDINKKNNSITAKPRWNYF